MPNTLIPQNDPRHAAATAVLEAMHAYWKLDPFGGAVRWIEDAEGRIVIFSRGEYRIRLMSNIDDLGLPVGQFDHRELDAVAEDRHPCVFCGAINTKQYGDKWMCPPCVDDAA
jgi:hypothetical protein